MVILIVFVMIMFVNCFEAVLTEKSGIKIGQKYPYSTTRNDSSHFCNQAHIHQSLFNLEY